MQIFFVRLLTQCCFFLACYAGAESPIKLEIDFPTFLSRSDPTWHWSTSTDNIDDRPSEWVDSLFGGNGDHGFQIWSPTPDKLRMDVSKQTLWDDRTEDLGAPYFVNNFVIDQPRLPTGNLQISWNFKNGTVPVLQFSGRVILYTGIAVLNATTIDGNAGFSISAWASADYKSADVIVLETTTFGNIAITVKFIPAIAASTWAKNFKTYVYNPPPINKSTTLAPGTVLNLTTQPHLPVKGTAHSTAVLTLERSSISTTFVISTSAVLRSTENAENAAEAEIRAAALASNNTLATLRERHIQWWATFWPKGGALTIDHSPLEAFWWIQIFKLASGARQGRTVHDLQGPWFIEDTPWPDLHWDMNLEQLYYLPMESNRPAQTSTLVHFMEQLLNSGALSLNVPKAWQIDSAAAPTGASSLLGKETCYWDYGANCTTSPPSVTGNLLWTISLVQRAAEFSGNSTISTEIVCPILGRALQYYQHFQIDNQTDGLIHLPITFSPEYPGPRGKDANYDLSLYRWGLKTALSLARQYPTACGGPNLQVWNDTLNRLRWFPIDAKTGTLEIYEGIPYSIPHRHYSHLFSIWPLHLLNVTNATQYTIAKKSINLWLATPEEDSMFYRPAASAMNTLLGQHAAAFDNITYLLDRRIEGSTWYREGPQGSCTETPYAGAWAVVNWLIQSWNTTDQGSTASQTIIDFFPGIEDVILMNTSEYASAPSRIARSQFWRMGVRGGALASGRREIITHNESHLISRTTFIALEAPQPIYADEQSQNFTFVVRTNMMRPLAMKTSSNASFANFEEIGDGQLVEINGVPAGGIVALYSKNAPPLAFTIQPVEGCPADYNHWGTIPRASPTPHQPTCSDYSATGLVCNERDCFECHSQMCSTDGVAQPPNCGAISLAEPVLQTPCSVDDLEKCAIAAASACDETTGCNSFSLDPEWSATKAKLWRNNGTGLVQNTGWNTWVRTNKPSPSSPTPMPSPAPTWPCL